MPIWAEWFAKHQDIVFVVAIIGIMVTIFVPLPPFLLDFLLVVSITMSILILLTVIYVKEPIRFSVFPSVLLLTTSFRLALNVATTRQILANAGREGTGAAGQVIETFGNFVAGAEPVIGFVIFSILVIVNFVVITKGSNRISEVAARFTLDAMPGKQMAIDADLNAGLIKESEARRRREQITKEADFYGAMDGASKFVRGDAIAGILITLVNVIAGFIIGWAKYGMTASKSLYTFTILAIGDGLVSQIPALIVALGAGLIVTRATAEADLGQEFMGQIFGERKALVVAGLFLLLLVPTGLPWIPLLFVAILLGVIVWVLGVGAKDTVRKESEQKEKESLAARRPEKVEGLLKVDPMELEIGYGLIRLVDPAQGGALLDRVTRIRRQMATDLGLLVPPIRIRDNMQLEPHQYVVKIHGIPMAEGTIMADQFLAMDSGAASQPLEGMPTKEPAFGLTAYWVSEAQKQQAEAAGYAVVDPTTVMATHITELIKQHAHELLTREDVNHLVKTLKESSPAVVEELVPAVMKPGEIQKVLQNLLKEGVSIRDLGTILETLGDYAPRTKDPEVLTEYVRNALGRTICHQHVEKGNRMYVITLDPKIEDLIKSAVERTEQGTFLNLTPQMVRKIGEHLAQEIGKLVTAGHTPVILCSPQVRVQVRKIVDTVQPGTAVLSYNEIVKDVKVEALGMVAVE